MTTTPDTPDQLTARLNVPCTPDLWVAVERAALSDDRSMASWVRQAIKAALAGREGDHQD